MFSLKKTAIIAARIVGRRPDFVSVALRPAAMTRARSLMSRAAADPLLHDIKNSIVNLEKKVEKLQTEIICLKPLKETAAMLLIAELLKQYQFYTIMKVFAANDEILTRFDCKIKMHNVHFDFIKNMTSAFKAEAQARQLTASEQHFLKCYGAMLKELGADMENTEGIREMVSERAGLLAHPNVQKMDPQVVMQILQNYAAAHPTDADIVNLSIKLINYAGKLRATPPAAI